MKILASLVGACAALGTSGVSAQQLADPMRPTYYRAPGEATSAARGDQGSESGLTAIWSVGARRYAMLDGKQVQVGGVVGGRRVSRITDTDVMLSGPEGRQTLSLVTGIEKTVRKSESAPAPRRTTNVEK